MGALIPGASPKAEVPGWREAPFEKCVDVVSERKPSVPTSEYLGSGRFAVVDQGGGFVAGYTNDEARVYSDSLPMVVFGDHTRAIKYVDFPFATGADGTKLLRANQELLDPQFLYFSLLALDIPSRGYNRHFSLLRDVSVLFPKKKQEQRAVAGVLAKIQRAVEVEDTRIVALKELKAATMAKVFREGLRGEPLKQTEIGEIPESWNVKTLEQVVLIERGKFAHRPRNDPRFYGGDTPFVQTGDVVKANGRLRSYTQTLSALGLSVSRVFPRGTIVLTIAANIGDTAMLDFDSAFPDSLVGLTARQDMDSEFLEFFLRTQKPEMDRLAPKGTQKNINIQFLRPWLIPEPSPKEQQDIATTLRLLDQREDLAERKLATLQELFDSALERLITGQVRVTPLLNDEEAGHA